MVFSFWKATLDITPAALGHAQISCLQIDGNIKPDARSKILEVFCNTNKCQVLLLSLSCGAVG